MKGLESIKVDFVIAGTQKGGTSAFDAYLREHPEICMAAHKELHFFDGEQHFADGQRPDYAAYHQWFSPSVPTMLLGEATPIYMYWHSAPRRIRDYNPAMKWVVLLRNPIERAYSAWNMERDRRADSLPFWDALQLEEERCRAAAPLQHRVFSYIDRGFYSRQLERIWTHFPREQTLVLRHDELKAKPQTVLDTACRFLGVRPFEAVQPKDVHSRPYVTRMTSEEWRYLRGVFEPDIRKLEALLQWDCSDWLVEPARL